MKNQAVNATRDRVTIRDVAHDAGVSVAAVSKVLRNAYGVSEVLRTKVEISIEKLNYRPSVAARAMRGRTQTVGVQVNCNGLMPRREKTDRIALCVYKISRDKFQSKITRMRVRLKLHEYSNFRHHLSAHFTSSTTPTLFFPLYANQSFW